MDSMEESSLIVLRLVTLHCSRFKNILWFKRIWL